MLFICIGNSGLSHLAAAFFNMLARGRAKALSAGTDPADAVDPTVVEAMREVGIDIGGNRPKALTPEMLEQAERVITMGCGVEGVCPATFIETEDWALEDPRGKPLKMVREIREQIQARVLELLEEMPEKHE